MIRLSAGCVMCRRSAATLNWSASATAKKRPDVMNVDSHVPPLFLLS